MSPSCLRYFLLSLRARNTLKVYFPSKMSSTVCVVCKKKELIVHFEMFCCESLVKIKVSIYILNSIELRGAKGRYLYISSPPYLM